jgi:hypothetical protein
LILIYRNRISSAWNSCAVALIASLGCSPPETLFRLLRSL